MNTATITDTELQRTLGVFSDVVDGWPGGTWTWDARFGVPVAVVRGADLDEALGHVRAVMPFEFTSESQAHLPERLAAIVARSGGLRPGQLAFCDTVHAGSMRFLLWWPWNNGSAASLRAGITD